ncbi:hypothetical protein CONLIGDRAFT_708494 [Coniochaeta ligniaria NRRL 30616]|uniref:Uncharacterized protein n=1 Tax=Coniochaeta ligniaria NRRL 30616 TaxID=1408157 RepID=A0A1J7IXC7_9PEZI|nr:hypothetical protein CONLIGDRAFT_708494 [Coniochaeta ligniaria NRRL 30616]
MENTPYQIPALRGEENMHQWNSRLLQTLDLHGSTDYILKTSAEVTKSNHGKRFVFGLISQSISPVRKDLENAGWDFDATVEGQDPKDLYDLILRTIDKTGEAIRTRKLVDEFTRVRPSMYATFKGYMRRLRPLRRRLRERVPDLSDEACVRIVLAGVKECQFYAFLTVQMKAGGYYDGEPNWKKFISLMAAAAIREGVESAVMVQPRTDTLASTGKTTTSTTHQQNEQNPNHDFAYHDACGRHHKGGDGNCWKLHPHLCDEFMEKVRKADEATPLRRHDRTARVDQLDEEPEWCSWIRPWKDRRGLGSVNSFVLR